MNRLPPGPWWAPSAAVYAADDRMVCSLGGASVVKAYRDRGDGNGAMVMATAQAIAVTPDLMAALRDAEATLTRLYEGPARASEVIYRDDVLQALVHARAVLARL